MKRKTIFIICVLLIAVFIMIVCKKGLNSVNSEDNIQDSDLKVSSSTDVHLDEMTVTEEWNSTETEDNQQDSDSVEKENEQQLESSEEKNGQQNEKTFANEKNDSNTLKEMVEIPLDEEPQMN